MTSALANDRRNVTESALARTPQQAARKMAAWQAASQRSVHMVPAVDMHMVAA